MDRHENIRDYMDDILEPRGFYRKHVATGRDSLARSVADSLFATQKFKGYVEDSLALFKTTEEGMWIFSQADDFRHKEPRALAKLFGVTFEIISTNDDSMKAFIINPDGTQVKTVRRNSDESSSSNDSAFMSDFDHECNGQSSPRRVLLCFTEPHQYDPIFHLSMIEAAGIVQSILYELLYEKVFQQEGAYEASKVMLGDHPQKPIKYDRTFTGGPMEAIEMNLIPFPFKVAKAMDPSTYRNIEYDVWTQERRTETCPTTTSKPPGSPKRRTVSSLPKETPCYVTSANGESLLGFIQGPISDGSRIEVFLPQKDVCIYSKRREIFPLKSVPEELKFLRKTPKDSSVKMPPALKPLKNEASEDQLEPASELSVFEAQIHNHRLALYDPTWLQKFNFGVPPPNIEEEAPEQPSISPASALPSFSPSAQECFPTNLAAEVQPVVYQQPQSMGGYIARCTVHGCNATSCVIPLDEVQGPISPLVPGFGHSPVSPAVPTFGHVPNSGFGQVINSGFGPVPCSPVAPAMQLMSGVPMVPTSPLVMPLPFFQSGQNLSELNEVTRGPQTPLPVMPDSPTFSNQGSDGVFWMPFLVSGSNYWDRSSVPPGTPIATPLPMPGNVFRFDMASIGNLQQNSPQPWFHHSNGRQSDGLTIGDQLPDATMDDGYHETTTSASVQ